MLRPMRRLKSSCRALARRASVACFAAGVCGALWAAPAGALLAPAATAPTAASVGSDTDSANPSPAAAAAAAGVTANESAFVSRVRNQASEMVLTAMNFLGVPYRRGGQTPEQGFDCSGLTRKVFETSLGRVLPRRADEQAKAEGLVAISRDDLRPGDLVFFNTLRRTFSHVGIYIGDGKFIHAPRSGARVRIEDLTFSYWAKRFTGARRVDDADTMASSDASAAAPVATLAPIPSVR